MTGGCEAIAARRNWRVHSETTGADFNNKTSGISVLSWISNLNFIPVQSEYYINISYGTPIPFLIISERQVVLSHHGSQQNHLGFFDSSAG